MKAIERLERGCLTVELRRDDGRLVVLGTRSDPREFDELRQRAREFAAVDALITACHAIDAADRASEDHPGHMHRAVSMVKAALALAVETQ